MKQTKLSEHIVKSIIQPVSEEPVAQHSFTTEPKSGRRKGHSPIRDRCLEFMQILKDQGYTNCIPIEDAKRIFQIEMGIFDRKSLKAYFGCQASKSTRVVRQRITYATGTISVKNIELTQDIRAKKGYLDTLGLVYFELRGNTFFMNVLEMPVLVPTLEKVCGVSKDKISPSITSPTSISLRGRKRCLP